MGRKRQPDVASPTPKFDQTKPVARAAVTAWEHMVWQVMIGLAQHYENMEPLELRDFSDICPALKPIDARKLNDSDTLRASMFADSFFGTDVKCDFALDQWDASARFYDLSDPLHHADPNGPMLKACYFLSDDPQRLVVPMVHRPGALRVLLAAYCGHYPAHKTSGIGAPGDSAFHPFDRPWRERRELRPQFRSHPAVREFIRWSYQRLERKRESEEHINFLKCLFTTTRSLYGISLVLPEFRTMLRMLQIPQTMLAPYRGHDDWTPAAVRSRFPDWTVRWSEARAWIMKGLTLKGVRDKALWQYSALDFALDTATY